MGEGQLLTLERIESLFAEHSARLSAGTLTRMQLLDIATVLSCTMGSLSRLIGPYREMDETRSTAEQASATVARVAATITWLRKHGQDASEREVALRILTVHAEAVHVLTLLRQMERNQQEVRGVSEVDIQYQA